MSQTKNDIQAILSAAGISPLKRYGQHFLIDGNLMDKLVRSANICRDDVVLEVGTGTGSLTKRLIEESGCVVTVEIDKGLYNICKQRFAECDQLTLIHKDVLDRKSIISDTVLEELTKQQKKYRGRVLLVADLPYQVATPLIVNLLMSEIVVSPMCFTVQAEVADRIQATAGGKDYGPISILAQALADIETIARVPPQAFWPMPKVDSIMLRLQVRHDESLSSVVRLKLAELVHACFQHRRKTMKSNLRALLDVSTLQQIDADDRWDLSDRPERITVPRWIELTKMIIQQPMETREQHAKRFRAGHRL